jgi:hypothetical protein
MKRLAHLSIALFLFTVAIPSFGDDQQKAEKLLHKISAMATDGTGRRVVNMTVADALAARRINLVIERRIMNLNYGDLFVAHELVKSGAKLQEIADQLKAQRNIGQIANEQHADWKQIVADAKKLNSKMEDNLYNHFVNAKADAARDAADKYDPMIDGVKADNDVSKDDIADAEHTYLVARDRADKQSGRTLDSSTEKAVRGMRGDPVGKAPEPGSIPAFSPPLKR